MPALDAPRERVSCDRRRRLERRSIANFHHWAAGFCVGDFLEHALRRRRDAAWLNPAGRRDLLCRVSPNAFGAGGHGVLPSPLLLDRTDGWAALVWTTQHGQRRLLCHSRRAGCRFRNSHARAVPPGACRRRTTSESYCHFRRKTWSSGVLWRAHDCSWIPRAGAEWRHEFFATWCAHCDWHFRRRPVHVLDFVAADCDWLFADSPAPFPSEHTFLAAKEHPRESRS